MRTATGLGVGLMALGLTSASFAAGCGNGDDDDTSGGGGTTDSGAAGDSGGGGGSSTSAGGVAFQAGGTDNNGESSGYQIVADFVTGTATVTGGGGACGAMVGSCQFCGGGLDAGTVKTSFTAESAGTLTVDDGTASLATLTQDPTELIYESDSSSAGQSAVVWSAGDTLDVSASGGAFPAFSGSIKAPAPFTGVTPAFADLTPLTVATSGLTLSWTPAGDSSQVMLLVGVDAAMNSTSVSCTVADSAGQIVVPASLLAQLDSSGDPGGTVSLTRMFTSSVTASGGATVTLTSRGVEYSGSFNFSP